MSLISGNSGGATKWSDGYAVMPMYPQNSEVQQCDKCGKYFYIYEQNECGYASSMVAVTSLLTLSQWYGALGQFRKEKQLDKKMELMIRLHILWCYNHFNQSKYTKNDFEENCNRLSILMNKDGEEYLIMSAEICRELGYYNKCIDLLQTVSFNNWGNEIKAVAIKGLSDVFVLKSEEKKYCIFI